MTQNEFKGAADGEMIPLQEVWVALGGNPEWFPTKYYVEELMKLANESMDIDPQFEIRKDPNDNLIDDFYVNGAKVAHVNCDEYGPAAIRVVRNMFEAVAVQLDANLKNMVKE